MRYENITTDSQLRQYCQALSPAEWIGFDTEFVTEHTFRPLLCLIQVCTDAHLAVIDPLAIGDLTPFWEAIARQGHQTIVHSGRGEVEFCLQAVGRQPAGLFDVQIAAGLVGAEYPAGYANLVSRLLGEPAKTSQTRTDWRRRPLSEQQIEYALDDVRHLPAIRDLLHATLQELGRLGWMDEEMAAWQDQVQRTMSEQRWWKVSGNTSLSGRGLAIVRELWHWRQAEAERLNKPPRRVLRDDLIVELARRQTADIRQIRAVRGMEWGKLRHQVPEIAQCIQRALAAPEIAYPRAAQHEPPPQLGLLGQFLWSALGSICRQAQLAPSLVGCPSDVRDLILYRTGQGSTQHQPPLLARGWRAEVVGRVFEELLAGTTTVRISDPMSEHPLAIETTGKPEQR